MENNKKSVVKITFITILSILVLGLILGIVGYMILCNLGSDIDDSENVSTSNSTKYVDKVNKNEEYVYDANYEKNVSKKSYVDSFDGNISVNDIRVPYINIKSDDAEKVNSKLKEMHDELVDYFKENLKIEDSKKIFPGGSTVYYNVYRYDDILSVSITKRYHGGTDVDTYKYYAYNFDIKTGNLLSYDDLISRLGSVTYNVDYTSSNVKTYVSRAIDIYSKNELKDYTLNSTEKIYDGMTYTEMLNEDIKNYENSISDNSLVYYCDSNGNLNVVVNLLFPWGAGHFDTVLTIDRFEQQIFDPKY